MHSQNYSFVVRVWLDSTYGDKNAAIWRGSIEQVGSDSRIYFSDLDGLTRCIHTMIEGGTPSPVSKWQLALESMRNGFRKIWQRFIH